VIFVLFVKRVIYHSQCFDGIAAAYCFRFYQKYYHTSRLPTTSVTSANEAKIDDHDLPKFPQYVDADIYYYPAWYKIRLDQLVGIFEMDELFLVDFSLPAIMLQQELLPQFNGKPIHIFDHHKTALINLTTDTLASYSNLHCVLDLKRSGCQITWDQLFPTYQRPAVIDYIADRDLWLYQLPDSKEITSAIYSKPCSFETIEQLVLEFESTVEQLITEGREVWYNRQVVIKQYAETAQIVLFHDIVCAMCDVPFDYRSETGDYLLYQYEPTNKQIEIAFLYTYNQQLQKYSISLRSRKQGDQGDQGVDVSSLAEIYGGGGHREAASFQYRGKLDHLTSKFS
jgi:hypothetical protein